MEQDLVLHIEKVNEVAAEYLKGSNESQISATLGIPRARVSSLLNEWKSMASNSAAVRGRAREALAGADQHYSSLIKLAYEVIDEATQTQNLNSKTNGIKLVVDIEAKRIDMLQKAGLLENKELADQLIETERKQEAIMKILKEVSGNCPHCKVEVLRRLSALNNEEAVVIYESDGAPR